MRIHGRSDTVAGMLRSSENGSSYNAVKFAPGVSKAPALYPSPKRPTATLPEETGEALGGVALLSPPVPDGRLIWAQPRAAGG